ncbi:MAG: secretin N-terminal domain-containing protein [Thermodesulfobacteriota bacterium]
MKGINKGRTTVVGIALVLSLILIAWGCGRRPSKTDNPFFDQWRAKAERAKAFTPSRAPKKPTVAGQERGTYHARQVIGLTQDKPLPKRRITVKLRDLDVSMVLRAVARAVNQNIVINEAITGQVTVDVKNVPWDQVFLGILRTQGLAYAWEGDILRVMSAAEKAKEEERDIRTVIVPILYSDAEDLQKNIQTILTQNTTPGPGTPEGQPGQAAALTTGSVMVDKHNNALIIQASREEIERLLPVIEMLDRPTRQVLIEAHIVEANKETARELGVQWGGLYNNGNQWIYPGLRSTGITGSNLPGAGAGGVGINPTLGWSSNFPAGVTAEGIGLSIGYMLVESGESLIAAQLNALQKDGKLNILSSPSITTLDHQPALIESGREVPFRTTDEEGKIKIEWKKATLKLEVTPHVIDEGIVKLKIATNKDELDWTFAELQLGNPTIITKHAETNVIVGNGLTRVIGGLNK